MNKPEIEVGRKSVDISGQCVYRPVQMSASEWLNFWETVRDADFSEVEILRQKLKEALDEIKVLEEIVSDMRDELRAKGDY